MSSAGRLAGKAVIVTGGSRGIGFSIAQSFAREGADLLLVATDEDRLRAAQKTLGPFGRRIETLSCDITDAAAARKSVAVAIKAFKQLDVLVNAAGVYTPRPFLQYSEEDFNRLMQVNLHAPFRLMQQALGHMVARQSGRVINVASTAGKWASIHQSAYNASKHGLIGLTRCAALEFAQSGITVNAICPGMVQTDMADGFVQQHAALGTVEPEQLRASLVQRIAQRRFIEPSECAELAVYLASDASRGMTGQSIVLDGGTLFL